MVAVKLDLPAELLELIDKACVNQMDGSSIDACAGLEQRSSGNSMSMCVGGAMYLATTGDEKASVSPKSTHTYRAQSAAITHLNGQPTILMKSAQHLEL